MNGNITLKFIGNILEKFAEKSENVYWLTTPDLKTIQYVSPSYEKIWGRPREHLYTHPELWITYMFPEDAAKHDPIQSMEAKIVQFGPDARYEESYRIVKPDGQIRWILDRGFPLYDNDVCYGVTGVAVDVTKEKLAEEILRDAKIEAETAKQQEEELRKAIMVLAGSIVHDLRTPLATVGAIGHTLNEIFPMLVECYKRNDKKDIPPSQQLLPHQLKLIANFPQRLNSTTQEMNIFIDDSLKALRTAITGIKSQDDLIQCSLWSCLQNAIERYPFSADEKKLIHWDRTYEFNFMGNPILFYRIIFNLIKNALYQIHKNGQGEIYISAEETSIFNILKVKDTAGDVTEETVQKIFNGFQSAKEGGTGVGLAFCKLAMESISGNIECNQIEGNYIEFILRFPRITNHG